MEESNQSEYEITNVTRNKFDNDISYIYKVANRLEVPVKYVVIYNGEYDTMQNVVDDLINEGSSLTDIYKRFIAGEEITFIGAVGRIEGGMEQLIENDLIMFYYSNRRGADIDESIIVGEIRDLYKAIDSPDIIYDNQLGGLYSSWNITYKQILATESARTQQLINLQNELSKLKELIMRSVIIDFVIISSPTIFITQSGQGRPPTADDGIDIFNRAIINEYIPYLQYNGDVEGAVEQGRNAASTEIKKYYKVFTGKNNGNPPNYQMIIPQNKQTAEKNTIYMTIWGKVGEVIKPIKGSYMRGEYDLERNILSFGATIKEGQDEHLMAKRITDVLPISIDNLDETKVGGNFILYNLEIYEAVFLDLILNDPLLNAYLYVEESSKPYALKKRLTLHYKSIYQDLNDYAAVGRGYSKTPSSVRVTLIQEYTQSGQNISYSIKPNEDNDSRITESMTVSEANIPYVTVHISRAVSRKDAEKFSEIFNLLMKYYTEKLAGMIEEYRIYFPNVTQQAKTTKKGKLIRTEEEESKINILKHIAPELFVSGYARSRQGGSQPTIIPEDMVESWQRETFIDRGVLHNKQVLPFPPNNPKWYFVCDSPDYPYPGVARNTASNRDIYAYVPSCFKKDQMALGSSSYYNEFYNGISKKKSQAGKKAHEISTYKILDPGRIGVLPTVINSLLQRYMTRPMRYGVINSANSLLHCISIAVDDRNYLYNGEGLRSDDDREIYVLNIRNYIKRTIKPELFKQELYDNTNEEILDQIGDPTVFFDPSLFYRALEELYRVNIFVFHEDDTGYALELPRYKQFHSRPKREYTTILIYKHWGKRTSLNQYPQCELIIDTDRESNTVKKVFGSTITKLIYDVLMKTNRFITWSYAALSEAIIESGQLLAHGDLYSRVNYVDMLINAKWEPVSQFIDVYGKMRGLIFKSNDQTLTIVFPPSQPQNLSKANGYELARYDLVLDVFQGQPTGVSRNGNNFVGIWYAIMDLKYGVYIPIEPINNQQLSEIERNQGAAPPDPLVTNVNEESLNVVERTQGLRRELNFILQIVLWLFILSLGNLRELSPNIEQYSLTEYNRMIVDNFIGRYIEVGYGVEGDTYGIYNISNVKRYFPEVTNIEEGMNEIGKDIPTLIRNGKIYLYSEKFSNGIRYYLELYMNTHQELDIKIPRYITNYYQRDNDFIANKNVALIIGEINFNLWFNSIRRGQVPIRSIIKLEYASLEEPYFYVAPEEHMYFVQNVIAPVEPNRGNITFNRALNVAFIWNKEQRNLGYRAEPYEGENLPYAVYTISQTGTLQYASHNFDERESLMYLRILDYGSRRYAALLPAWIQSQY